MKKQKEKKRVVLAYSGGLDTSVICGWLHRKGYEVICYVCDLGQREALNTVKQKALASGAAKVVVEDRKEEFVNSFIFPALAMHAKYEGRYLLGTALARPVIAKGLVEAAQQHHTKLIAHGATGKGNDQVRFELSAAALLEGVEVIAPWREEEFNRLIPGRQEAIAYAKKYNIPVKATKQQPWSSDGNLMHLSFEAGMLEAPEQKPLEKMFEYSCAPQEAPNRVKAITLTFKAGRPVALDEQPLTAVALMEALNELGGSNGIGREDLVESRFVGMKSRGVYETPGATILEKAHRDLETLTLSGSLIELKDTLSPRFAKLAYNGFWYSREMDCLLALLRESQAEVNGTVFLELYKGNVTVVGRKAASGKALYDPKLASMEADQGAYSQKDAEGFIRLHSLPLKAERKQKKK